MKNDWLELVEKDNSDLEIDLTDEEISKMNQVKTGKRKILRSKISMRDVELLFKLRTRMVDVKNNFSNKYGTDIACRLCNVQAECQEHLIRC